MSNTMQSLEGDDRKDLPLDEMNVVDWDIPEKLRANTHVEPHEVKFTVTEHTPISPQHYKLFADDKRPASDLEALDVIQVALTEEEFKGYLKGNQIKYLLRHKNKNGDEDLKKSKRYAEFYEDYILQT